MQEEQLSLTTKPSESYSMLPDDVWGEVFSFFCEDFAISSLLLLSKHISIIVHQYTKIRVQICRYQIDEWESVYSWLEKFKRLAYVDISSSNCKSSALQHILQHRNSSTSISITKCFGITEDVIQDMSGFENVALSDIEMKLPVPLSFFANLHVLIFSNNTFGAGSLRHLFEHFPSTLTVLALGGCTKLAQSYQPTTQFENSSLRKNLYIEVTFLEENDRLFLNKWFPHATQIDLAQDTVEKLDSNYKQMNMTEKGMSKALVSCHDSFNSTPLHVACRKGDLKRVQWLLGVNGRHCLKDCKGSTPLHRAVESSQLIKPQRTLDDLSDTNDTLCDDDTKTAACDHHPPSSDPFLDSSSWDENDLPELVWPEPETLRYRAWQCAASCLQAGASCLVRNQNYETPLYVAALRGNDVVLYTMIAHLRKTTATTVARTTNLPTSNRNDSLTTTTTTSSVLESTDYLSIDEKSSDLREFSPLHAAILSKSLYCIRLLLLAGCSPNKQNKYGSTAMHLAFRSNVPAIITMITNAGGSLDIKDASGDLPICYSPDAATNGVTRTRKTKKHHHKNNKNKNDNDTNTNNNKGGNKSSSRGARGKAKSSKK